MTIEEFWGDEGSGEDLMDAVSQYGYYMADDGMWVNDDEPGKTLSDEEMADWLENRRYDDNRRYGDEDDDADQDNY